MSYDDQISAVVQWVNAASGVPIYRAGQDFHKPTGSYGTVELSLIDDINQNNDVQYWTADEVSASISRRFEAELVFSVNIFATDPLAIMAKVKANARAAETYIIVDGGLMVHDSGPISSLRELENARYADRAQMNLMARVHIAETQATEIIEEVPPVIGQTFE